MKFMVVVERYRSEIPERECEISELERRVSEGRRLCLGKKPGCYILNERKGEGV